MQPHEARMITERTDLSEKTQKLTAFIFGGSSAFSTLPAIEQSLLKIQLRTMEAYLEILDARLDIIRKKG